MVFQNLKIPKLIHKTTSAYNELIEVFQADKSRRLSVNGVVQSISCDAPSVSRRVWGRLVEFVSDKKPKAKNILMFGLGGGTMVHLFKQVMPNTHITIIEIDSVMIKVAEDYFDLKSLDNYTIVNEDVMRVMTTPEKFGFNRGTFDTVIVDIYCGIEFPNLGNSGSFLSGIKWFLRPEGLVVVNRINIDSVKHEVDAFIPGFKDFFKNVGTSSVAGRTNNDNLLVYGEV